MRGTEVLVLATLLTLSQAQAFTAKELLMRVDDLYRGRSAQGFCKMEVKTSQWKRSLKMQFWSKDKDRSLVRIITPKKEKGTSTLRSAEGVWNYLPKVDRVLKLPSSMMSTSWMGSHFSNDDLVKQSRFSDDYSFEITKETKENDQDVVEITCTPRPKAPIAWGKVKVKIDRINSLPLEISYYHEDNTLARTLSFSEVQEFQDRKLPARLRMTPADKKDEYTELQYEEIKFDLELPDKFFSLLNLRG